MRKTVAVLSITALLVVTLAGAAAAAGPKGSRWLDQEWKPPCLGLNLSEEQLEQLREIHAEMYQKTRELQIKMMDKVFELKQLYFTPDPDEAAIAAIRAELQAIQEQMSALREGNRSRVNNVLTQEQLAELGVRRGMGRWGQGRWGSRAGGTSF